MFPLACGPKTPISRALSQSHCSHLEAREELRQVVGSGSGSLRNLTDHETALLNDYLAGWAQASPLKIIQATRPDYRLSDPSVGEFTRSTLPQYFEFLQLRFAISGPISGNDLTFLLRGPMDGYPGRTLQFSREAPRIGLIGMSNIKISNHGVMSDNVAYDLNLAFDVLSNGKPNRAPEYPEARTGPLPGQQR